MRVNLHPAAAQRAYTTRDALGEAFMRRFCAGLIVALLTVSSASAAIILEQLDDFEDGTLMGWGSGGPNPNPPIWTPGPGSTGFDDAFVVITGNGESGSGGNLVVFNSSQWAGDYIAAGVNAISLSVQNYSLEPVQIGLRVEGPGGNFTSVLPIEIPADSFWDTITLALTADSLAGGADLSATLSNVTRLRIQDPRGPIAGSIGVDNITALPEPGALGMLALLSAFGARRRW